MPRARPKKDGVWLSRALQSRKLPGAWAPRADHRQPSRPELAAAGAENVGEHGWRARGNQKTAEKCRSGFQNQREKSEETGQKNSMPTTQLHATPPIKTS